jgi:hypothetical protein
MPRKARRPEASLPVRLLAAAAGQPNVPGVCRSLIASGACQESRCCVFWVYGYAGKHGKSG